MTPEERARAIDQARELMVHDPEAAEFLLQQVNRQMNLTQVATLLRKPYNPRRMYTIAALNFGWTPFQIDRMHYPLFFGVLQELAQIRKEEEAQSRTSAHSPVESTLQTLPGMYAQAWEGDTVPLPD